MRAWIRIGQLSRELETHQRDKSGRFHLPTAGKMVKAKALAAAGISTSSAHRAEQLADHAEEVEAYIAKKRSQKKPVKHTEVIAAVL